MDKVRLIWIAIAAASLLEVPADRPSVRDDDEMTESAEAGEWRRFNERCASDSLKTISSPEADFIADERDEHRLEDFWTADVATLYTLQPQEPPKEEEPDFRGCDRD